MRRLTSAWQLLPTSSARFLSALLPKRRAPKVISAARKALELDPDLAEAHVLLANVLQEQWHWADAEAEYRRALELNPNDADAHAGLALWLLCQGRTDEAVAWARRGRELDPLAVSGDGIAWILFQSHRYDEAIRELRSALAVRPDDADCPFVPRIRADRQQSTRGCDPRSGESDLCFER